MNQAKKDGVIQEYKEIAVGVYQVKFPSKQLLRVLSEYNTQEIVVGTDRGKAFTGIAFQSKLATIALFHACLPGFYKSKKTSKDRQSVTGKMLKCTELRRTRRGQRINRKKPFKLRNHRQKRFSNRHQNQLPPSIKANRQMELLILLEMATRYLRNINNTNFIYSGYTYDRYIL
ncbi:MAG: RRXRR domain-containing protein [Cyanobacteria bacterium J06635_10]